MHTFLNKKFPESYSPTMCESYRHSITEKDGSLIVFDITDCPGNEDFAKLRYLFVFMLVKLLSHIYSLPSIAVMDNAL
jgi:hypothetical protein